MTLNFSQNHFTKKKRQITYLKLNTPYGIILQYSNIHHYFDSYYTFSKELQTRQNQSNFNHTYYA